MSETNHPRSALKSIGAVAAGVLAVFVLSLKLESGSGIRAQVVFGRARP